jgi:Carboxypeptidase regulatory-like domain
MFSSQTVLRLRLRAAACVVVAFTTVSTAQVSRVGGGIQGTVIDQSGSAVAGATVALRNQATNRTRTTSTDVEGFFRASELPVGQYDIRVQAPGFSLYTNNSLVVSIGRVSQLTVRLVPAVVQQQITVSEQPSSIDTSQTTDPLVTMPPRALICHDTHFCRTATA